jgi:MFS family permease
MLRKFLAKYTIVRKDFFVVFILLFNAFTWWYLTSSIIMDDLPNISNVTALQTFTIQITYILAIITSSLVGAWVSSKINQLNFIYFWIILGVAVSPLPILLGSFEMTSILIVSILMGVAFGLGMPSCLAYFSDSIPIEKRGLSGGIVFLITNLSALIFTFPVTTLDLTWKLIFFTLWRATGLIILFFRPSEKVIPENKKRVPITSILSNKSFMFYFIAWLMFCFVDRFENPILRPLIGGDLILIIGLLVGSFSSFVAGILCDRIGRKRVILYGFATLGIAYAIMGIAPTASFSGYIYTAIDSVSTGILWVTFLLIIWGDLSQHSSREMYYAIGGIPFFFSMLIQEYLVAVPDLIKNITEISAFSVAAFFLFLAVLPLLYAPETLPEKKMELRRLRKFADEAVKAREKYERKING